ncbi:MAG: branched-chain amino acid ABC transporter substrate-binding protein [Hyphomicrobium sp.]
MASPTSAEVTIAAAAPLSGPDAAEGKALVQSVEWAITDINARGGIAGERLALVSEDDACDDRRAATAAARLAERKPALVIGHPCSGPAQAAAKVYASAGLLFIATAPRHPDLTRRRAGPSVFRLAGRDDLQGAATASYLAAAYAGKRLAIVHDRTRYARTLVEGFKRARQPSDAPPVPEFGIVASSKDYAATVAALRAHRAEVVYFAGFPSEAVALWRQFRATDLIPDLVGSDALANADAELRALSDEARVSTRVMRPFTAIDVEGAQPLAGRLAAAGMQAYASAIAAYAAVEIWTGAAARGADRDPMSVSKQLQGDPIASPIGLVSFDANGDADVPSFAVATVDGNRLMTEAIVLKRGVPVMAASVVDSGALPIAGTVIPPPADAPVVTSKSLAGIAASAATNQGVPDPVIATRSPPLPVRHPLRRNRSRL